MFSKANNGSSAAITEHLQRETVHAGTLATVGAMSVIASKGSNEESKFQIPLLLMLEEKS